LISYPLCIRINDKTFLITYCIFYNKLFHTWKLLKTTSGVQIGCDIFFSNYITRLLGFVYKILICNVCICFSLNGWITVIWHFYRTIPNFTCILCKFITLILLVQLFYLITYNSRLPRIILIIVLMYYCVYCINNKKKYL